MAGSQQGPGFLRRVGENVLSGLVANGIWVLLLLGGGLAATWIAKNGGRVATIKVWHVAALCFTVFVCVLWTAALWRRVGRQHATIAVAGVPVPHPHARLLAQIDSLDAQLAEREAWQSAEWGYAEVYNSILSQIQLIRANQSVLGQLPPAATKSNDFADMAAETHGVLRARLGQLRAIV